LLAGGEAKWPTETRENGFSDVMMAQAEALAPGQVPRSIDSVRAPAIRASALAFNGIAR